MNDRVSITMLEGGIADVKMIRTDKMNALDPAMMMGLAEAIHTLENTAGLRVVVLSGEGKAFCAGLDMASMASGGSGNDLAARTHGDCNTPQFIAWGWRALPVPVIAAAHGVAFGGGFQILSGADIRIVHPQTRCAIMELKWGLVPDMAGFPLWRTLVRDDLIRELTYTNREFSGVEAQAMGFATHVDEDPYAAALALAQVIANKNPAAIRGSKTLCNAIGHMSDQDLLLLESEVQLGIIRKPNQIEAVMANMEKRAPVFAD
jgi:enoyl-CoA hydratase/carnithine racemase